MPLQETFLTTVIANRRIEVVKTYDQNLAREAFDQMEQIELNHLASSLELSENYEQADIPANDDAGFADFVWDEVLDSAREDGNLSSFFVVTELNASSTKFLFVSPDWPTAQAYVNLIQPASEKQ